MKLHKHFYVAIVILAVAAVSSEVYFRYLVELGAGEKVPLNKPLRSIPLALGDWQGQEVRIPSNVMIKIAAEDVLRRTYYQGKDRKLELYIAYFGGIRGTAPHRPTICRPGAGFSVISSEVVLLKAPGFGEEALRVHRDVYERHYDKEMVVWWEYVHGKNVASRMMQRLQWALPKSMGGKRGSVLQVQISLGFKSGMEESMHWITDFMGHLGPHIEQVLPVGDASARESVASREERRD